MSVYTLDIATQGQGLYDITDKVWQAITPLKNATGLCTIFIRHTSASLTIQENADPAVQFDLQNWFNRLVPENDPHYTHTQEGADDMPAHIKTALTQTHLSIPIDQHQWVLGTWQGIYLWEHRHHSQRRTVVIHISL